MYPDVVLALHITAGVLALTLGPLALLAARRRGPVNAFATAYHWAVLAVCASAAALVAAAPARLWWLLPIAVGSYALALLGFRAARRPGSRARRLHIHGQGGSYIALVTALLVVSVGSAAAWIAPTLIGAPLISWAIRREETRRLAKLDGPRTSQARRESDARLDQFRGSGPDAGQAAQIRDAQVRKYTVAATEAP